MILVNFGYLVAAFRTNVQIAYVVAVVLAAFKLFWNTVFITIEIKSIILGYSKNLSQKESKQAMGYETSSVVLQTSLLLLNNFIVPNMANAFIATNCLNPLFSPVDPIVINIPYRICTFINGITGRGMS